MQVWNPWHGCHKKSPGCLNCYMFRRDALYDKDSNLVMKTKDYELGIKKYRNGNYYLNKENGMVYVCMTSDFFISEADNWRNRIWQIIKMRSDLNFTIITKRIERFNECIPDDWGLGYPNVTICVTAENQKMADERIPILLSINAKHKEIIHEPLLEKINIEKYLKTGKIDEVTCGGESGSNARPCNYDWILDIKEQCKKYNVPFYFKQTGANFIKDNKEYKIDRKNQLIQAKKANISTI